MSKCSGCGIEIQNQNQDKAGYIPFSVMTERMAAGDEVLCQRCYRIKHYNKFLPVGIGTDFYQKLEDILQTFNTIVWVIDIIDFEGTFRTDIALKLKNKNLIIAVNKADLLPNAVKYEEIKEWVCDRVSQVIRVKRDNIRIISTRSGFGINRLSKMISEINDTKVAVIGVTNVGKSSVLNEITDAGVTVSSYPGTTLNFIKTRLKDSNIELYDTPGIEPKDRVCDFFDIFTQVKMIPAKEISRKTFRLQAGRVMIVSALCYFKVLPVSESMYDPVFLVYAPQNVSFHETKEERIKDILENRKVIVPPYDSSFSMEGIVFEKHTYEVNEGEDIAIPGLGWISVRRGPLVMELSLPQGVTPVVRSSLIKPHK